MSTPEFYFAEARLAEEDAGAGRAVAARLLGAGGELGAHLDQTRQRFTTEVWESATADERRAELSQIDRGLGQAEDDLRQMAHQLGAFADRRDQDAAHFWAQYALALVAAAGGGS